MASSRRIWILAVALTALVTFAACDSGPKVDPAVEAEWEWIQETKSTLDAKRAELADLKAAAMAPDPEEDGEEADAEAEGEEAEAEAEPMADPAALEEEITAMAEEFQQRLYEFINDPSNEIVEGQPLTERQMTLIAMKSDEEMLLAREWIDRGGDYKRAIEIYQGALLLDPENQKLKDALAAAESNRYMSEERFAAVAKGMSADAVRAALGTPNHHNVRQYPEKNVEAWFYPTAENGAAAGVWFEMKNDVPTVYQAKYDAVQPKTEEGAEG